MRTETERNATVSLPISRFYDVVAEQQLVQSLLEQKTPKWQILVYLRENVSKFLLEFAAGVKKTSITYRLHNDGRLYYPGFAEPIANSLERAFLATPNNSREQAEFLGWLKIEEAFANGAQHVLQLSPPSPENPEHGNYGFLFWFERDGGSVVNHILRYNEQKNGNLQASWQVAAALGLPLPTSPISEKDYLLSPIVLMGERNVLLRKLEHLGFDIDATKGYELEKAILSDPMLQILLEKYMNGVVVGEDPLVLYNYLAQLYNLGLDKAEALGLLDRLPQGELPPIFFGGSCSVVANAGLPVYSFADWLLKEPFSCPNCGYVSFRPVGDTCPSCGITKEEWLKENEQAEVCE